MNLRLLGVGTSKSGPARLWNETMLLTLGGLVLAVSSGLLLFSIDPEMNKMRKARFSVHGLAGLLGKHQVVVE